MQGWVTLGSAVPVCRAAHTSHGHRKDHSSQHGHWADAHGPQRVPAGFALSPTRPRPEAPPRAVLQQVGSVHVPAWPQGT